MVADPEVFNPESLYICRLSFLGCSLLNRQKTSKNNQLQANLLGALMSTDMAPKPIITGLYPYEIVSLEIAVLRH